MAITPEQLLESIRGKTLRAIRHQCYETSRDLKPDAALKLAENMLAFDDVHGVFAACFLAGHISYILPEALDFLREKCSQSADIRARDALALAFDHYCLNRGYERAMPVMEEWARSSNEVLRRAVAEAPRPWTRKDYFKERPAEAIAFLSKMKSDPSSTVRFSAGRALAEISEDFPDMVLKELRSWPLKHPPIKHTYSFAAKHLHARMGVLYTE